MAFKNFALAEVSTGYDDTATSIDLATGDGAKLPAVPFQATWWNKTDYGNPSLDPDVEIVTVTAVATDTLTIARAAESTAASVKNAGGKTYGFIAGPTAVFLNSLGTPFAAVVPKTASFTLVPSDCNKMFVCTTDSVSDPIILTLPDVYDVPAGWSVWVRSGDTSENRAVLTDPDTFGLVYPKQTMLVWSDGAAWQALAYPLVSSYGSSLTLAGANSGFPYRDNGAVLNLSVYGIDARGSGIAFGYSGSTIYPWNGDGATSIGHPEQRWKTVVLSESVKLSASTGLTMPVGFSGIIAEAVDSVSNPFAISESGDKAQLAGLGRPITGYVVPIQVMPSASYTLTLADSGTIIKCTYAGAVVIALPNDLPAGFNVSIKQAAGTGTVTLVPDTDATMENRQDHNATAGEKAVVGLFVDENIDGVHALYSLTGDTAAA